MRSAYKALVALEGLKDATDLPKTFTLGRSFGMVILAAANTLKIAKAEMPTAEPAEGEKWLTSKTPIADGEITPYDLLEATGTEGS